MPNHNNRLLPEPGEVRMRLYGQGLGDCFLLAFPRPNDAKNPCYLLIDCGAAMSTPGREQRQKRIVEDIREATGGHLDILAITHQHFDHISGFQDAWQEWEQIKIDALYLPWTETTAEQGEHTGVKDLRDILDRAAKRAVETANERGFLGIQPGFRAQADFLGVELGVDGSRPADMDKTMDFIRDRCPDNIRYFKPGDVFRLPGTPFHGYVLGPPLRGNANATGKDYIEILVDETDGVMYSYRPLGMEVDAGKPGGSSAFALSDDRGLPALASALLAAEAPVDACYREADEGFCPFAPGIRLDWDHAMSAQFFREHYGDTQARGDNGVWRRVDSDWLAGAANLALRAGSFTNNVSLVLAFDAPPSKKMLLFPGDAQAGNWLSWHTIESWTPVDNSLSDTAPAANDKQTLMENLLSRVVFYKVGHHGSHNATIKDGGLERMTHEGLVAYIPVSVPIAQDKMGYCPMPFYPVLRALQKRTEGRVFLPSGQAVGPLPEGKTNAELLRDAHIVPSAATFPAQTVDSTSIEQMNLYLEVQVATSD